MELSSGIRHPSPIRLGAVPVASICADADVDATCVRADHRFAAWRVAGRGGGEAREDSGRQKKQKKQKKQSSKKESSKKEKKEKNEKKEKKEKKEKQTYA